MAQKLGGFNEFLGLADVGGDLGEGGRHLVGPGCRRGAGGGGGGGGIAVPMSTILPFSYTRFVDTCSCVCYNENVKL